MDNILFKWAVAATFAEDGDHLTAINLMEARTQKKVKLSTFDKIMAAITFSEVGLHNHALDIIEDKKQTDNFMDFLNDLGLDYRNCFLITIDAN